MSDRTKVRVPTKIKAKLRPPKEREVDYDEFLTLTGTWIVNGEEYYFPGGILNVRLFAELNSDILDDLFNGKIAVKRVLKPSGAEVHQFLEQERMLNAQAGHCVGKMGIAFVLRQRAVARKTTKGRNYMLREAQRVEEYFDKNFADGVPLEDLERYCQSEGYHVTIDMPMLGIVRDYKPKDKTARYRFKFTHITVNHLDLIYGDMDPTVTIVERESEFNRLMGEYEKRGCLRIRKCLRRSELQSDAKLVRVWNSHEEYALEGRGKEGATIVPTLEGFNTDGYKVQYVSGKSNTRIVYQFDYLNERFILGGYEESADISQRLGEMMLGLRRKFIDSRAPYYNFIKRSARTPCHYFTKGAFPDGAFDIYEYPDDMKHLAFRADLWKTDMHACYRQRKTNPYYIGFPVKPNNLAYNICPQRARKLAGWWLVDNVRGSIPYINEVAGHPWTTPDINLFLDNGLEFDIPFGIWDSHPEENLAFPTETAEMPLNSDGKLAYCIFSGLLNREPKFSSSLWRDASGMMGGESRGRDKLQLSQKDNWRCGCNYSSYVYAYARTRIMAAALRHKDIVVGISVDALITKVPLRLDEGLDPLDGKPIWSEPERFETKQFAAVSYNYPSGFSEYTIKRYPLNLPKPPEGLEHSLPEGNLLLTGLGGSGKSWSVLKTYGWLAPTYVAPTLNLIAEKEKEGWLFTSTPNRFYVETDNPNALSYLRYDLPKIIFVDEVNITPFLDKVLEKCRHYNIRYILAGDEAQITSSYCLPDIWKVLPTTVDHILDFKTDRRSGDPYIKDLKFKVRKACLRGDADAIFDLMRQLRRPTREKYRTLPLIKMYRHDEDIHGELGEGQSSTTVDSMQGQTVRVPHICIINRNTRKAQLPQLLYTMVSRFVSIKDIYVLNTTCLRDKKSIDINEQTDTRPERSQIRPDCSGRDADQ